jgi:hypothetical protein
VAKRQHAPETRVVKPNRAQHRRSEPHDLAPPDNDTSPRIEPDVEVQGEITHRGGLTIASFAEYLAARGEAGFVGGAGAALPATRPASSEALDGEPT